MAKTVTNPSSFGRFISLVAVVLATLEVFAAGTFKPLPFSDPFAPANSPGDLTFSQASSSVILNESLVGISLPITRTPAGMNQGLKGITIEWWMKQKPNSGTITSNPDGTIVHGPGFAVNADWQWGGGPGSVVINFSQNKDGQYVGNRGCVIPLPYSDEQWHHYVVTYDLRTVRSYFDGELLEQKWLDNNADNLGPYEDDSYTIKTSVIEVGGGVTTSGRRFQNGYLEAVRVSTNPISPWEVKRNYENARVYTRTLYVAPNGTGTGTAGSPASLAAALALIGGATRIVLQGGTYNGGDFQVTRSGTSAREHCVIVGADGSTPAIISGGSPALSGAGWISLRNLTFSSDSGAALQVNNAPKPVTIDSCRFSGAGRGLSVSASPKVSVLNCVANAGTGLYFTGSSDAVLRHNTIMNGSVGAQFDASSVRISMLNNLMSGQSSACLVINSSTAFYRGNGNLYNPSGSTAVTINGTAYTPAQVTSKALANAWYTLDAQDSADGKQRRTGHAAEANSMAFAPTFVDPANGDYRLASVQANAIDAGAERTFQHAVSYDEHQRRGNIPTVTDAMGVLRPQGNGPDVGAYETVPLSYAVFYLDADYTCSAGVYKPDGTLIRTLFSGQRRAAGTNVVFWNGLTDAKQPALTDSYTIKMIAHNVQYVWEGAVGNSSNPNSDSQAHASFEPIEGMAIVGTTAFYTAGYNESKYELYRFDTSNPNRVTKAFGPIHNIYSDAAMDLATDGTRLYTVNSSQVAVYNVSDCSASTFGNGQSKITVGGGRGWIEVQRNGNLLFISRRDQNLIYIYDKASGNMTGSFSVSQPTDLALNSAGELWVLSANRAIRYQCTSTTGTPVQTISGFGNALNIACSPVDGSIIVSDGSTHQIKAFTAAGAALWTHGQANGYAGSPRVTSDKFCFYYIGSYDQAAAIYFAPLAFQPDGTFWLGDTFLSRSLHFNTSRQLLNEIDYMPHTYNGTADINNPTRVFNRFTEYAVDYSKPLAQGWTITNFWGFNCPGYMYGFEDGVFSAVTLSNGRTYGTIYDGGAGATRQVVELTATGLRETSVKSLNIYTRIQKDGSLLISSLSGGTVTFQRRALTGFNAAGDPQWGTATSLGSAPVSNGFMTSDPYSWRSPQMSGNLVVSFDDDRTRTGYHLGAVKQGTSQWLWKAMPSAGGFDGFGNFESWCEYGGTLVMTSGRNIFAGAHGEFYNDVGQANQYFHYYDNGLFIGEFGNPLVPGVALNAPGASGNARAPVLVDVGTEMYLYHNDEWGHGSQRWHPVGANAIRELASAVSQGQAPLATTNAPGSTNSNLPAVTVLATTALASESGTDGVFTITRSGSTASALTVNYTISGTAGNGTDYSTLGSSAIIPAGAATTVVTVAPVNDTVVELGETVILTLSSSSAYTVGAPSSAIVTILDNDTTGPLNLCDLVVLSVSASPANPAPGQAVTFSATIKNQGTLATPSGVTLGIGFYIDGSAAVTSWSTTGQLQPGQTATLTANDGVSGPAWTAAAGNHSVLALVDDVNRMTEIDESNNSMALPLTVGTGSTNGLGYPKITIRPAGGGNLVLTWPATNGGVYQVSYKTALNAATWTTLSGELTATGNSMSFTDAPPAKTSLRFYNVTQIR